MGRAIVSILNNSLKNESDFGQQSIVKIDINFPLEKRKRKGKPSPHGKDFPCGLILLLPKNEGRRKPSVIVQFAHADVQPWHQEIATFQSQQSRKA